MSVTFSDPIPDTTSAIKVLSLKRTKNYGSKHHDEPDLTSRAVTPNPANQTIPPHTPDPTSLVPKRHGHGQKLSPLI